MKRGILFLIVLMGWFSFAQGGEKLIVLDDVPKNSGKFTVAPDGSRLYFAANKFLVLDAEGSLVDQIGTPGHSTPKVIYPLPEGGFISISSHAGGHVALVRPDGTEKVVLVKKGPTDKVLRSDMTGWTSPCGGVVDVLHKIIFVIDTTMAKKDDRNIPDPNWSRIAKFDFDGKYLGDINRYDADAPDALANDYRRTWYRGIALDPERERLYVGAQASKDVLCFSYEGKLLGKLTSGPKGDIGGGVTVFPDGRIGVTTGKTGEVDIYSPELTEGQRPLTTVKLPDELGRYKILDIQTDAQGQLYASVNDRSVLFVRWTADFKTVESFGPRYQRLTVQPPGEAAMAGKAFSVKVAISGRPQVTDMTRWHALAKRYDGSEVQWIEWQAAYKDGALQVTPPGDAVGVYDLAITYGEKLVPSAERDRCLFVSCSIAIVPPDVAASVAVISDGGRRAFRQGETIPFHVIRRTAATNEAAEVQLAVTPSGLLAMPSKVSIQGVGGLAMEIPGAFTRRLAPGHYQLVPTAAGHASYPLKFIIAQGEPDSPMQRIMYHEFGGNALEELQKIDDSGESMATLRDWNERAAAMGFTRETVRNPAPPSEWGRMGNSTSPDAHGFAPPEYYPLLRGGWALQRYLDDATAHGVNVDMQLLGHCGAIMFSPQSLARMNTILQTQAQSFGRYPSFYGFNYNDEMFMGGFGTEQKSDRDLRVKLAEGAYANRRGELVEFMMDVMYDSFNAAVREVAPDLKKTATPMWQFPAFEGSYAPSIYRGMDESYSHYLSEGYDPPWYPSHSAEFLRRPGKPLMGVSDNTYNTLMSGERYLKNVMQVVARGVQGVGANHTSMFKDIGGATAYQVANELVRMYGPVFADFPPANEAAILYSRTQDFSEGAREAWCSAHWDRVFELFAAGLMGGVPARIVYEEDIAAGCLVKQGKPVVPMLFLAGQTLRLPDSVEKAIRQYISAGGRLFEDADSAYGTGKSTVHVVIKDPVNFLRLIKEGVNAASSDYYKRLAGVFSQLDRSLGVATFIKEWRDVQAEPPARLVEAVPQFLERLQSGQWSYIPDDAEARGKLSPATLAQCPTNELQTLSHGETSLLNASVLLDLFPGVVAPTETKEVNIGQARLNLPTYRLREAWRGAGKDSWSPLFHAVLEKSATDLRSAVGAYCRFPVTTSDLWVSKNGFDGGAIRYVMLATETSPYPWDAGNVWFLGDMFNKGKQSWLPKRVDVSFPGFKGVVYDVFNRSVLTPGPVTADLRTFPGCLYALAPREIAAPQLTLAVTDDTIRYTVKMDLAARVPLRVKLVSGDTIVTDIYRGTDGDGKLTGNMPVPVNAAGWSVEITELLGGKATVASGSIGSSGGREKVISERARVDIQRDERIRELLKTNVLTLVTVSDKIVPAGARQALAAALTKRGITLQVAPVVLKELTPGTYLAAGYVGALGPVLDKASLMGLLDFPLTPNVPGAGRGLITSVFAARGYGENAIALIGGDAVGLEATIAEFIRWLDAPVAGEKQGASKNAVKIVGKASEVALPPRLSDRVGVRLTGVKPAGDGKHLLVTAEGYWNNLLLIDESSGQPEAIRAARVGQAYEIDSPFVSPDGSLFGASGRTINRFGQGFQLVDAASGSQQVFADYGDIGRQRNQFAVTADGSMVVAPGTFGVVCWRRTGNRWKEAWSLDYWKEFGKLDWPVSASAERIPQFHAFIPRDADYALILFGEYSANGWIGNENHCDNWLAAVNLADGKERWRFNVPIPKMLLFPALYASPSGKHLLLQVQMGVGRTAPYRVFSMSEGKSLGFWNCITAPVSVALDDPTGRIATVMRERLIELHEPDGKLLLSMRWPNQPASLAFSPDGQNIYVADEAGRLTCLTLDGNECWKVEMGSVASLGVSPNHVYAAAWDGRVRCYNLAGKLLWNFNCTKAMNATDPMAMVVASASIAPDTLHEAVRPPTTLSTVPTGANLLRTGMATLTLGGTPGWYSRGTVQIKTEVLTNGVMDDVTIPWLHLNEVFWDGGAGRQVYADITFPQPTAVKTLTVYENVNFPASWPTEGRVQVWNESNKSWDTAGVGLFLTGPVNTYTLNLKAVTKLRYVPWNCYYRNFHTSEIEVR